MPQLSELSPYVQGILADNHLTPLRVLRYGPRYVCVLVQSGNIEGLFKMALPISERTAANTPEGYVWTEYDDTAELERRLLKEALFLQFFSTQLGASGFEPQIIALSETSPIWSLRTYITERTMSAWDSNFILSHRFYESVMPRNMIDFFNSLQGVSGSLPANLSTMIANFRSTLLNAGRFERALARCAQIDEFKSVVPHLDQRFKSATAAYAEYQPVLNQYEPYGCHIFVRGNQVSLIDWENVGWGHKLQDPSVLWMRCFENTEWQNEYIKVMREHGYFDDHGQLYWESELLIQSFANHQYFAEGGPVGTAEYDQAATKFFAKTIRDILSSSDYFGVS